MCVCVADTVWSRSPYLYKAEKGGELLPYKVLWKAHWALCCSHPWREIFLFKVKWAHQAHWASLFIICTSKLMEQNRAESQLGVFYGGEIRWLTYLYQIPPACSADFTVFVSFVAFVPQFPSSARLTCFIKLNLLSRSDVSISASALFCRHSLNHERDLARSTTYLF